MNNEMHPGRMDGGEEPSKEYIEELRQQIEKGLQERRDKQSQKAEGPEDWKAELDREAPRHTLRDEEQEVLLEKRRTARSESEPLARPAEKKQIMAATEDEEGEPNH